MLLLISISRKSKQWIKISGSKLKYSFLSLELGNCYKVRIITKYWELLNWNLTLILLNSYFNKLDSYDLLRNVSNLLHSIFEFTNQEDGWIMYLPESVKRQTTNMIRISNGRLVGIKAATFGEIEFRVFSLLFYAYRDHCQSHHCKSLTCDLNIVFYAYNLMSAVQCFSTECWIRLKVLIVTELNATRIWNSFNKKIIYAEMMLQTEENKI